MNPEGKSSDHLRDHSGWRDQASGQAGRDFAPYKAQNVSKSASDYTAQSSSRGVRDSHIHTTLHIASSAHDQGPASPKRPKIFLERPNYQCREFASFAMRDKTRTKKIKENEL